jgi:hypothetical protein
MEQTRVKKYKEYRKTLGKKDEQVFLDTEKLDKSAEEIISHRNKETLHTTTSIPYDEIMKETQYSQREEELVSLLKKKKILNIVLISVGVSILLAAIIIIGILIFK